MKGHKCDMIGCGCRDTEPYYDSHYCQAHYHKERKYRKDGNR